MVDYRHLRPPATYCSATIHFVTDDVDRHIVLKLDLNSQTKIDQHVDKIWLK